MILGIDFGYYSVKLIVVDNNKVHAFGEESIIKDVSSFDPNKIEVSHWVSSFENLCEKLNINLNKIDKVVSSISGTKVAIKPMTTLEMEESELINTLTFEAKKHIPLDGSEPVIDYHILGQNTKEIDKINLILVATTQKIIRAHDSILKKCKIKNSIFDTDPIALLNCYKHNYEVPKDDVDVLVNIGFLTTTILIYGDNQELLTREISIGAHHVNLAIMDLSNIDYHAAEKNKIDKGMDVFELNESESNSSSIQISQRNIISELSDEIRKTLRYYMKSKVGSSYNKFYISGGLSNMKGLVNSLNTSLNVEFLALDPFKNIDCSDNNIENFSSYVVSMGLILRAHLKDNKVNQSDNKFNFKNSSIIKFFNMIKKWLLNGYKK